MKLRDLGSDRFFRVEREIIVPSEPQVPVATAPTPATIAAAVHDGHREARELDAPPADPDLPFRREHIRLDAPA